MTRKEVLKEIVKVLEVEEGASAEKKLVRIQDLIGQLDSDLEL